MVAVRVSETYDLSTKIGKMGLVGIHTPTGDLISRMWPGLILQHEKFRFVKCDVAMACASMLPADPLQIGVEAGAIAPQDMFNPILYKAVSNESMNQFQAWLNIVNQTAGLTGAFNQGSVVDVNDPNFVGANGTHEYDQFSMYYALLADSDGWRKSMPQAGLEMRGLYPLVFQVVSQFGSGPENSAGDADSNISVPGLSGEAADASPTSRFGTVSSIQNRTMRGPSMRMPAIDTTFFVNSTSTDSALLPGGINVDTSLDKVPPAYVGLIILPPARLNQLYYRLKVTWTIEFTGLRSAVDISNWFNLQNIGQLAYGSDYESQSAKMSAKTGMVDTTGSSITKIMEGS
ncbi:capsid protein [Turkey associated porprismacovirus 1]|uniref:Capsid protein n=1 Tax=Turkey associated porprismacovirus 1 TaxID=2170130 RepID=W0GEQ0_9VIRU|nr:capsid protein [Turkey associated porprismacovirus 1]AHF54686.1 capsid protein [Turkey associated porprismacovirus 1]